MSRIAVITQSGSDLTPALAEAHHVYLLPDRLIIGDKEYLNNVDIGSTEFFSLLDQGGPLPKTAHPNPEEFRKAYEACSWAEDIICIVMSSETTGTIASANLAKDDLCAQGFVPRIHIIDSRHVSFGLGLMAMTAGDMAANGESVETILRYLQEQPEKTRVVFAMHNLDYARRGGRIGNISARAVSSLGIVPLLTFKDGNVTDCKLCWSFKRAINAELSLFETEYANVGPIAVFHGEDLATAEAVKKHILERHPNANVTTYSIGPAVGLYTGRGCIGLAYTKGENL